MPANEKDRGAAQERRYRAKVTGRHAITLPAELCRTLEIENGDVVELRVIGRQATIAKADAEPLPPARGILRGYFRDAEDVRRYLEEERRGWAEREAELEKLLLRPRPRERTSDR